MTGDPSRTRRPTQSDVAALAGVSRTIVSAVIRGPEAQAALRVSAATRARVLSAIDEVGYIPNMAARSLASGRNDIIGVFTYDPIFPVDNDNFYHDILVGIEDEADRTGHSLLLSNARKDHGERSIYRGQTNTLRVADGVIVIGGKVARSELAQLHAEGYPYVIVGRRELPGAEPSWISPDYVTGARRAFAALRDRGHVRIGMVHPDNSTEPVRDRAEGVRAAAVENGIADQLIDVPRASGPELLEQVRRHHLTAVLSAAKLDAVDLLLAAHDAGMSVPHDFSILSLGGTPDDPRDIRVAQLRFPRKELGRQAVHMLMSLLNGTATPPVRVTLNCELDLEPTVGPAPDHQPC